MSQEAEQFNEVDEVDVDVDLEQHFEVVNWRKHEYTNSSGNKRLGYFDIRFKVGTQNSIKVDSFRLLRDRDGTYFVVTPSERDKEGAFRSMAWLTEELKNVITEQTTATYLADKAEQQC